MKISSLFSEKTRIGSRRPFSDAKECPDCGGTVSRYDRHVLVFTGLGSDKIWASHVEADNTGVPVINALGKELKRVSQQLGDEKVKVSAVSADSVQQKSGSSWHDAILFPGGKTFQISTENAADFVRDAILNNAHQLTSGSPQATYAPVQGRRLILVCVHGARDKLCGSKGPALQVRTRMSAAKIKGRSTSTEKGEREGARERGSEGARKRMSAARDGWRGRGEG